MNYDSLPPPIIAGMALRKLISENYKTQEEFAYDFGTDIRTVNRYINQGISKLPTIQELAIHFRVNWRLFFDLEYIQNGN